MKKALALLLSIGMSAALLTGCGGGGKTGSSLSGTAAQETQKTEQASAAAAEPRQNAAGAPAVPSAENTYLILVQDADDASPLSGVTVQFCSDTECMVNRTDENGSAAFEAEPGNYTAHVLKVPAGYEANREELSLTAENRMASFSLCKEGAAAETQAAEESQAAEDDPAGKKKNSFIACGVLPVKRTVNN